MKLSRTRVCAGLVVVAACSSNRHTIDQDSFEEGEALTNGGVYSFGTLVNTSSCMDVTGGSTSNGTQIEEWTCNGGGAQKFQAVALDSTYYKLVNPQSGKCLDITGAVTADGTKVELWTCNGGANQAFKFVSSNGFFKIVGKQSGKCLDVAGANPASGTKVQLWTCNGSTAQTWNPKLSSSSGGTGSCSFSVTQNTYDGPNYWGTIGFKNTSTTTASGYKVTFNVPSGAHCTNDTVPSGATLSPLSGSGASATTTSNTCTFTWSSSSLAAGASTTFNYSTDSTSFSSASNVAVSASSCGGSSGGGTGGGGTTTTGGTSGTGCDSPNLVWKSANKTNFTSYPAPGSEECITFSGCMYEGLFAACSQKESLSWVQAHNIASVFPDFNSLRLHDLCIKSGTKHMVVTVLDECADTDCSGCCTQNKGSAAELIDLESFTDARFGVADGPIQWADLGPTKTSGCN
jgi:hypothetical protein